jgi:hypothetical protein
MPAPARRHRSIIMLCKDYAVSIHINQLFQSQVWAGDLRSSIEGILSILLNLKRKSEAIPQIDNQQSQINNP